MTFDRFQEKANTNNKDIFIIYIFIYTIVSIEKADKIAPSTAEVNKDNKT